MYKLISNYVFKNYDGNEEFEVESFFEWSWNGWNSLGSFKY